MPKIFLSTPPAGPVGTYTIPGLRAFLNFQPAINSPMSAESSHFETFLRFDPAMSDREIGSASRFWVATGHLRPHAMLEVWQNSSDTRSATA